MTKIQELEKKVKELEEYVCDLEGAVEAMFSATEEAKEIAVEMGLKRELKIKGAPAQKLLKVLS